MSPKTLRAPCPYCYKPFHLKLTVELKKEGLTTVMIKPHTECPEFVAFVDPNGKVRGTQTIDSDQTKTEKQNITPFADFFESISNQYLFYHYQQLGKWRRFSPTRGNISAQSVKYHKFLRSSFYKEWLIEFMDNERQYASAIFDNVLLVTINLYDTILLTIGFDISTFEKEEASKNFVEAINFAKSRAVNLGERLLS